MSYFDPLLSLDEFVPLLRHSHGSSFNHETNVIEISARSDDEREFKFIHELQHFLLHCGTPYGQFLDELAILRKSLVDKYLTRINRNF